MSSSALPDRERAQAHPAPLSNRLLNLPNFLTLCRIAAIPFLIALMDKRRYGSALVLFGAAAITDGLDGSLARWGGSRTELGAFLDPFADKLLLISSFVVLTVQGLIPAWILGALAVRDVVVVFGYLLLLFLTGDRIPVRPTYAGKLCTFLALSCIVAALLGWPLMESRKFIWHVLLYVTVAMVAISGLQYVYRGLTLLNSREPQMFS